MKSLYKKNHIQDNTRQGQKIDTETKIADTVTTQFGIQVLDAMPAIYYAASIKRKAASQRHADLSNQKTRN